MHASQQQTHARSKHVFGLLFAGYLLFVLYPILRANRPHNDDLMRMLAGSYNWNANGRPLTNLLMRVLELNLPRLVDVAPLPQLLAIACMALAGAFIARRYAIGSPWLAALIALPLGAQPFFLENLAFRFDAPAMGLSILLALAPVLLCRDTVRGFCMGALSLLGCLCSYQPALNVFVIFALLDLVARQAHDEAPRRLVRMAGLYVGEMLVAMIVYQWTVAPHVKDWIHEHSQTIHGIHQFDVVVNNAKTMSAFLLDGMAPRWKPVLLGLLLLAAVAPVAIGLRYALAPSGVRSRPLWVTACLSLFALLLPLAALACIAGPMLLLVSPVVSPRVFPSVGALISAEFIALHLALAKWRPSWKDRPTYAIAGIWALGMLTFANIYGNALSAQQQYENRIASQLSNDLAELKEKNQVADFLLDGSAGLSPLTAHAAEAFPLLNSLVPPYLQERDFNSRNFMKLYDTGLDEGRQDSARNARMDTVLTHVCDAPVLYTRHRYTLRLIDGTAVVSFTGGHASSCPRPDAPSGR